MEKKLSSSIKDNVIIVKLFGGLGNQMFQFAAAKSFAITNHATLKLDISAFNYKMSKETPRKWSLNIFKKITDPLADQQEVNALIPPISVHFFKRIYKLSNKKFSWINKRHIVEKRISFSPYNLKANKVYVEGYWQSFKYFKDHEETIRQLFDLSYLKNESAISLPLHDISHSTSVCLHVRRGDYLNNKITKNKYPVCSAAYYSEAIEKIILSEKNKIKIFVFSDDLDWCKTNLNLKVAHQFIQTDSDVYDLYLMSMCKHNIIANSSFSWWGAWLNNNPNKIVVAPANWHKKYIGNSLNDLLPESWIKI